MKKKRIKYLLIILAIWLIPELFTHDVKAETPGFSVVPILNEKQIRPGLGYFNLLLNPTEKQKLEFNIYNNGSKPIEIETTFGTSFTGDAGNILYTPDKYKNNQTLKINIKDYIKLPKRVRIPAHSKSVVQAEVTMPNERFDGVIAGGFNFNEKTVEGDNNKSNTSKSATSIINQYSYVIGLVMQNSENKIPPELKLGKVGASQRNSRNIISVNLVNSARTYLLDMSVEASATNLENKKIKYYFNSSSMEMAPNSDFDLAIPVSFQGNLKKNQHSEGLKPGRYQMNMTVFSGKNDNGQYQKIVDGQVTKYDYKWTFNKSFTITGEQSRKLNAKDVTIVSVNEIPWVLYILIGIVTLLILIIVILLYKQKNIKKKTIRRN